MTFEYHVMKALNDCAVKSPAVKSQLSHNRSKFGGDGHCGSGDIALVCYVISQDHVIKGLCDFGRSPSR